ncbi:MAG: hypothetical protein Q9228_004560 [Teloschistes exilis]
MPQLLSAAELHTLERAERVASIFSLLGASFIILTFILSSDFRKPVNRLIFYASWGNALGNMATLISQSGVRAGQGSALCQFQAFLIQMFFIADAALNLCMAVNVYLNVFKKYNAQQLKALEWRYLLLCYGIPFIPAFVYCFVQTQSRGKIYGPAQLWCWIASDWAFLRIALFYAPAWYHPPICPVSLRRADSRDRVCILVAFTLYVMSGKEIFRKRKELRAFREPSRTSVDDTVGSYKTTQISVFTEVAGSNQLSQPPDNCFDPANSRRIGHDNSPRNESDSTQPDRYEQFSTTINSGPPGPGFDPSPRPASIATATGKQRYNSALEANTAAWRYTKVAMLFFISLCVTWIPSSINRIYDLANPMHVSYPLNYVSALVLPLMGFWNAVIYFVTTRAVCAAVFWDFAERWAPRRRRAVTPSSGLQRHHHPSRNISRVNSGRRRSWMRGDSFSEGLIGLPELEKRGAQAV